MKEKRFFACGGAAVWVYSAHLFKKEMMDMGGMDKYLCVCGWTYDPEVGDPEHGVAPGTPFEDIPEDWVCPVCLLGKDAFSPV